MFDAIKRCWWTVQIGSRRSHDISQKSSLLPYLGSAPRESRNAFSRYYSIDDYRDILQRATELHIQVIPEIDMPGHMHAAIQGMRVRSSKLKNQGLNIYYFAPVELQSIMSVCSPVCVSVRIMEGVMFRRSSPGGGTIPVWRQTTTMFGWVRENSAPGRSLLSTMALLPLALGRGVSDRFNSAESKYVLLKCFET